MFFRYDDSDYDHSVLSFGDVGGGMCIMEFTNATRSLFGVSTSAKHGRVIVLKHIIINFILTNVIVDCVRVAFPKLQHHKIEDMKTTYSYRVVYFVPINFL